MQKWLKVMEVGFLETMHQNWLKLLGHVSIIPVQFLVKQFFKWMHGFHVRAKTNSVLCIFSSKHSASFCMVKKMSLGCDADMEMMEEEF